MRIVWIISFFLEEFSLETLNKGISDSVDDHNNRWRKKERVDTRKAKLRMRDH